MRSVGILTLSAVVGSLAFALSTAALAKPVPFMTPGQLQRLCRSNAGVFWPQAHGSKVYVCYRENIGIIVCGGEGKFSKTCDGGPALFKRRAISRRMRGH
jgi:hypothetical protein